MLREQGESIDGFEPIEFAFDPTKYRALDAEDASNSIESNDRIEEEKSKAVTRKTKKKH